MGKAAAAPSRTRLCAAAVGLIVASACGGVASTPTAPAPTPSTGVGAQLVARLDGTIACAVFPHSCIAKLSVLPAGTAVGSDWRPPQSDPYWGPEWTSERPVHLSSTMQGTLPVLPAGNYEIVVSLLGFNDTPSYNADGSVATYLLGRCSRDVSVIPATRTVTLRVQVTQGGDLDGTCSIASAIDPA